MSCCTRALWNVPDVTLRDIIVHAWFLLVNAHDTRTREREFLLVPVKVPFLTYVAFDGDHNANKQSVPWLWDKYCGYKYKREESLLRPQNLFLCGRKIKVYELDPDAIESNLTLQCILGSAKAKDLSHGMLCPKCFKIASLYWTI